MCIIYICNIYNFYKVFETIYDFKMCFVSYFVFFYVFHLLLNKHFKTNITIIYSDNSFVVDFFFFLVFFWDQNNVLLFCETNKNNYFFVKKKC